MRAIISTFLLLFSLNSNANAGNCPSFFRFVDFGLEAPDGTIHRGGATYRAESFDGEPLLIRELTVCRGVRDVGLDGRGNPIPVVESVNYNPQKTGIGLKELRLTVVEDVASETERSAAEHRVKLGRPNAKTTQGSNYLCASLEGSYTISCQLISPFGGNLDLVIYCSRLECRMPVLPVKEKVIAVATWLPSPAASRDHEALGLEIADKVQQLHDFLAPLSS